MVCNFVDERGNCKLCYSMMGPKQCDLDKCIFMRILNGG